jgi:hypothetical protein
MAKKRIRKQMKNVKKRTTASSAKKSRSTRFALVEADWGKSGKFHMVRSLVGRR